ncbi:hypothetical protein DFJ73DRAFT_767774 [Zopfochytrium polystomum]|nr:hypothetical protein DFJ73DRAFT_767774 [Zopfochytrium polystomum]
MREFLPPHVSAVCGRDSAFSSVPFAAVDSEGIAAVVDISGFTSLTSSLLEKHGTDGAAVLRETLKNAFSKIIERIYRIGQLYHVHVGKPEGQSEGPDRREYFIAGKAVSDAGIKVNWGHRGDLVLSSKYYQALASILAGAQGVYHLRMLSDRIAHEGRGAFIIKDRSSHFEGALTYFQREFPEDVTVPASKKGSIDRRKAVAYVEVSVAAFIIQSGFIADLDNDGYSDIRNTTVVFFRFPYLTIDLSAMAEAGLSKVQKISQEIIARVHAEGGSLRQINFDDKGFNALAVWGLRGLAHQRGEAGYALAACLNLFKALHKDGETVSQYRFTAGVASGTIYAVNKALLPTALLDQSKVSQGGGDELFGRSAELESILQEVKSWETPHSASLCCLQEDPDLGNRHF